MSWWAVLWKYDMKGRQSVIFKVKVNSLPIWSTSRCMLFPKIKAKWCIYSFSHTFQLLTIKPSNVKDPTAALEKTLVREIFQRLRQGELKTLVVVIWHSFRPGGTGWYKKSYWYISMLKSYNHSNIYIGHEPVMCNVNSDLYHPPSLPVLSHNIQANFREGW